MREVRVWFVSSTHKRLADKMVFGTELHGSCDLRFHDEEEILETLRRVREKPHLIITSFGSEDAVKPGKLALFDELRKHGILMINLLPGEMTKQDYSDLRLMFKAHCFEGADLRRELEKFNEKYYSDKTRDLARRVAEIKARHEGKRSSFYLSKTAAWQKAA